MRCCGLHLVLVLVLTCCFRIGPCAAAACAGGGGGPDRLTFIAKKAWNAVSTHPKVSGGVAAGIVASHLLSSSIKKNGGVFWNSPHLSLAVPPMKCLIKVLEEASLKEEETEVAPLLGSTYLHQKFGGGISLGSSLSLYHLWSMRVREFTLFDWVRGVELLQGEQEDGDIALLICDGRAKGPFCLISPMVLELEHCDVPPITTDPTSLSDLVTCAVIRTVPGYGWDGKITLRLSYMAKSNEVELEVEVASKPSLGWKAIKSTVLHLLQALLDSAQSVAESDEKMLKARDRQSSAYLSQTQKEKIRKAKVRRDRSLHPEVYERKHRWQPDPYQGGAATTSSNARWGEERRSRDLSLRRGH
jgi:hypothetical protein